MKFMNRNNTINYVPKKLFVLFSYFQNLNRFLKSLLVIITRGKLGWMTVLTVLIMHLTKSLLNVKFTC